MDKSPSFLPNQKELKCAVSGRRDWGIDLLRSLVAIDSVAPREKTCQEALRKFLKLEGLNAELVPLDNGSLRATDGFIDAGLSLEDRPNLVVTMGRGDPAGKSLILNSHIDTVTWQDDHDKWSVDPLLGAVKEGRIYGRGSVDAKGQIVTALVAALALRDLGYEPAGRLIIESAVCEEPTGDGTLALCSQGWLADAAVVLEPTGAKICFGHRGIVGLRYWFEGLSGHAAVSGGPENAIVQAGRLSMRLDKVLEGWQSPRDAMYGLPSVNVGWIHGGQDIFSRPFGCELHCGVRYAPGTLEDILLYINRDLEAQDGSIQASIFSHYDAAEVPPDSPLPALLLRCIQQVDPEASLATFPGGCDARHFINRYAVPAVIFGPGDLKRAHGIDEYIELSEMATAAETLGLLIPQWCG
jgi:acetylornithine deacetylase